MKKIVPDPPAAALRRTTAHTHFGSCKGAHPPVFSVHQDADIEDALVHLSAALTSAFETNAQLCEMLSQPLEGLAWATCQSLQICQALTEALLNGGTHPQVQV